MDYKKNSLQGSLLINCHTDKSIQGNYWYASDPIHQVNIFDDFHILEYTFLRNKQQLLRGVFFCKLR